MAVQLQSTGFVLELVGIHELVQEVDGRALGFGVLHPEVPQVGSRVAGEAFPRLEPGAAQLADDVLGGVHLQCCTRTRNNTSKSTEQSNF